MEASDAIVDLNTLTLHAKVKRHREHPRVINIISVQVKHPQFGDLVSLEAWRIFRAHCADSFLEIMDEDIDEMHQFSVTLFDKYGNLRPHLMSPGYRSGTGCWGQEVNSGQLLYILDMTVEEPYRGKGIGTWTLQQFLRTEHVQNDDTVICWPNPMGICDKALWDIEKKRQIGFFRKSDFRRIGRTNFFGYSPKRDHPSRSIPLEGDAGALDDNFSVTSTNVQLQFPLHFAIISDKTTNVASTIQSFYDQDPTSIHRADDMGFTPILVAVSSQNLIATRKLLEWDLRADLENAVNAEGVTPLEQLANVMRSGREFSEIFLGWQGYSDDELTMQYLLKQGMGQAVGLNLADYISKKKYGCTCDKCARGWLSPRMRFALRTDAQFWADSMPMNFDFFTKGRAADPSIMMDSPSSFIPPALYPNFYLTFYKGYCEVLTAISALLGTTDEVLSVEGVLRFINPDQNSQYFFQKGGRIEYAFDSITHCAKEQSSLGDDTFRETFGDHEDWVSLPTCANDLEFQLVRKMIGLDGRGQRWGPYHDSGFDEDEEEDEDEDEDDE